MTILFSQVALAAYACPMEQMARAGMEQSSEILPDCCLESAQATANLCHEHCKDSQVAPLDSAQQPLAFFPAFTVTLHLPVPPLLVSADLPDAPRFASSPPLSILNCCFRI